MVRSMKNQFKYLVSSNWLFENINNPNLIVLDATMKLKPNGDSIPTPDKKIPGAQAFNFDTQICDQETHLPHMMCSSQEFENFARKLGINKHSKIVVYDSMGIFSAPRVWWMFKLMGHQEVFVLNGGLVDWLKQGYSTKANYERFADNGNFVANRQAEKIYLASQVLDIIDNKEFQIIDARSIQRFNAEEAEPRSSLKSGHIPNSYCLPFTHILESGYMKSPNILKNIFDSLVRPETKKLIFTCGSGVTACILALAADESGYTNYAIYDGSWSEWGEGEKFPIAK